MRRHSAANVAVFVPHAGCPHQCVFCNQHGIAGASAVPAEQDIIKTLRAAAETLGEHRQNAQIAFFGGSFTAIPREEMLRLLRVVQPFLGAGGFAGIRISTRPDAIDDAVLDLLLAHGVTAIELGTQSMDDAVLAACGRGHTARAVEQAARNIRARGCALGLQMMTGLPLQTDAGALATARQLAALQPDTLRVYPALVLEGTPLAALWRRGEYRPQSLQAAVALGAQLLEYFQGNGIPVIRFGLHDTDSLRRELLAGPHHPALRELCEGRLLLQKAQEQLVRLGLPPGPVVLAVGRGGTSRMIGQKRANLHALQRCGYLPRIVEEDGIPPLAVQVRALHGQPPCSNHNDNER